MLKALRTGRQHRCRQAIAATHAELFLERYEELLGWAQRLTGDRRYAEDLLHDVFIHFTLSSPDLEQIESLDGYLRRALRNLFVTHKRRADCVRMESISMLDFDSADMALSTMDASAQVQARDELRVICQYACARKETSKAGSVLILRYFHGYFPSEIAQITRCTKHAVFCRLRLGRNEAQQYLENPDELTALAMTLPNSASTISLSKRSDPLAVFRQAIFAARQGQCLTENVLRELYSAGDPDSISCEVLAHIVSCPDCLELVNRLLHLAPLSERFPGDTIDPEDHSDTPNYPGGSSGSSDSMARMLRRRKDTFAHHPAELMILANGYRIGSQKTGSELIDQKLSVNLAEPLSLIEVLSNTGVRLLMLSVDPMVDGGAAQSARVALSDGRTLQVHLEFSGHWPTLHVIYKDPSCALLRDAPVAVEEAVTELAACPVPEERLRIEPSTNWSVAGTVRRFLDSISGWMSLPFKAAISTAALGIALIMFSVWNAHAPQGPPLATSVLSQAAVAEEKRLSAPGKATHRTLMLEERAPSTGKLIANHRIEVWQVPGKSLSATRLYNAEGKLVAGEWHRQDGTRVVLQNARLTYSPANAPQRPTAIWQMLPSPTALRGAENIRIEERPTTYVLHYKVNPTGTPKLLNASLTLRRSDLHAIEQAVRVEEKGQIRDYRLVETVFEQQPDTEVANEVFTPSPGFAHLAPVLKTSAPIVPAPPVSIDALQINALYRLDSTGLGIGEQIKIDRTPEGTLSIIGVVSDEKRKNQLLEALGPVARHPAIELKLTTQEDLGLSHAAAPAGTNRPTESRGEAGTSILSEAVLINEHAWALKRLTSLYSAASLRELPVPAQKEWLAMLEKHACAIDEAVGRTQRLLAQTYAYQPSETNPDKAEIVASPDFGWSAARLLELATRHERAVTELIAANGRGGHHGDSRPADSWRVLLQVQRAAVSLRHAARQWNDSY